MSLSTVELFTEGGSHTTRVFVEYGYVGLYWGNTHTHVLYECITCTKKT